MKKIFGVIFLTLVFAFGVSINAFADTVSNNPNNVAVTDVTLSKTSDTLIVGATDDLAATVNPAEATDKTVNWASSNTGVATVDGTGKVTAVSVGTAVITVTTEDGNKTATCNVTVNPKTVTDVLLNKTTDTLTVGNTDTLTATVNPGDATNKGVNWTSSNTGVATVDAAGKVTAVNVGTAVITVTTNDGNKTATCNVTVNPKNVTDVSLNKTTDTLTVGNTDTLIATVNPGDATNKGVNWTSSNTGIATVDASGKVTAVSAGSVVITATTVDGSKTAVCQVTVKPIGVSYVGHVQNYGWMNSVNDGQVIGTFGQSLRIEALKINLTDAPAGARIKYQMHVQNIGWQAPVFDGQIAGTTGQSLRVEAIKISLVNMPGYSVEYRGHVQNVGWQPWTEDGCIAGTEGLSLRLEAIQIRIVKTIDVKYQVHAQNIGWEDTVSNGTITGTKGQPLRIEAMNMKLQNAPAGAYLKYQTHVQNIGWMDWTSDGNIAGTVGQALRIEALRIQLVNLPGYSVQYQVFVQNFGWQPWVSDGQAAGTSGLSLRIEGIRIRIIANPDGSKTPEVVQPSQDAVKSIAYKLTSYLDSNDNIASVQASAIALHHGSESNNCVYFSSEAMRRIGVMAPTAIANTAQYVPYLNSLGLKTNTSADLLSAGDVCFTVNDYSGHPSHTFLFLGWVNPDDHTVAYVMDNQSYYVHARSLLDTEDTDAFAFSLHD